ncbi:MAG: hypothetical protein N3D12_05610 [Candidatus Methanomethyliaceae archaeon]|nr:hypothetical protein [Candidatus Methanomethyliaceae archaeon]
MPSRIIVYKSILVGWLLLSGTIGYVMISKVEWLCQSMKDEGGGVLEKALNGGLQGVYVDLEGFKEWVGSIEDRQK